MNEEDYDKAEKYGLYRCNCEDESYHVEVTYHKRQCEYRKWFEQMFGKSE